MHTADVLEKLTSRSEARPDGCREWVRGRDQDGYGILRVNGRTRRAHRISWEAASGMPVPLGQVVRHACDNPPCIESSHLILGTTAQNNRDREARGRSDDRRGDRCPTAKLTWPDVREIRRLIAKGATHKSLAAPFGVSREAISLIARGERWKELPVAA